MIRPPGLNRGHHDGDNFQTAAATITRHIHARAWLKCPFFRPAASHRDTITRHQFPLQAITSATRNAAALVNATSKWGTLTPGEAADIVVDGRPDRRIGDTRRIETVIQAGKVIDRKSLKFDPATDPGFRVCTSASSIP